MPVDDSRRSLDRARVPLPYVPLHQGGGYTATAAWLTAATGVGEAVIIAGANGYLGLAKSDHKRGGITFEAAKAKDFTEDEDKNSPPI